MLRSSPRTSLLFLSPDLPDREPPAQILVELARSGQVSFWAPLLSVWAGREGAGGETRCTAPVWRPGGKWPVISLVRQHTRLSGRGHPGGQKKGTNGDIRGRSAQPRRDRQPRRICSTSVHLGSMLELHWHTVSQSHNIPPVQCAKESENKPPGQCPSVIALTNENKEALRFIARKLLGHVACYQLRRAITVRSQSAATTCTCPSPLLFANAENASMMEYQSGTSLSLLWSSTGIHGPNLLIELVDGEGWGD